MNFEFQQLIFHLTFFYLVLQFLFCELFRPFNILFWLTNRKHCSPLDSSQEIAGALKCIFGSCVSGHGFDVWLDD